MYYSINFGALRDPEQLKQLFNLNDNGVGYKLLSNENANK